jgi:hypothetical protein
VGLGGMPACFVMAADDYLVMYILMVARTQKLFIICKYDEVVYTNPSCNESLWW